MKPKILVTREVFDETLAYLGETCDAESNQSDQPFDAAALAQHLKEKDGVVCCLTDRIDAAVLAASPRLKVVANIAVGYNNIDVPACTARGVMVTNTPGVLDDSTADLAFTLMLAAARRLTEAEAYVRAGDWKGWHLKQMLGVDVHHATLGIIGMGRIGQQIARRAQTHGYARHSLIRGSGNERAASHSAARRTASEAGSCVGESGWLPSPSVPRWCCVAISIRRRKV